MDRNLDLTMIKGVIFDFDGTLISSSIDFKQIRERIVAVLNDHSVPSYLWSPKESSVGITKVLHYIEERSSKLEMLELEKEIEDVWNDVEMSDVANTREVPGAMAALDRLRENGYKLGILTRASRTYVLEAMRIAGFQFRFDGIVCRDDHPLEEAKPNPISLKRTAAQMELEPVDCLTVGDNALDMECAQRAGSVFIGVLSGSFDLDRWKAVNNGAVLHSVSEIPLMLLGP